MNAVDLSFEAFRASAQDIFNKNASLCTSLSEPALVQDDALQRALQPLELLMPSAGERTRETLLQRTLNWRRVQITVAESLAGEGNAALAAGHGHLVDRLFSAVTRLLVASQPWRNMKSELATDLVAILFAFNTNGASHGDKNGLIIQGAEADHAVTLASFSRILVGSQEIRRLYLAPLASKVRNPEDAVRMVEALRDVRMSPGFEATEWLASVDAALQAASKAKQPELQVALLRLLCSLLEDGADRKSTGPNLDAKITTSLVKQLVDLARSNS